MIKNDDQPFRILYVSNTNLPKVLMTAAAMSLSREDPAQPLRFARRLPNVTLFSVLATLGESQSHAHHLTFSYIG